ncbi:MAG: hypothetical protein DCC58_18405 [Chloroflexi bacterium]|nr:MAG: hypothetical protein DCC58_18405 [Chloroflexota bacterium]
MRDERVERQYQRLWSAIQVRRPLGGMDAASMDAGKVRLEEAARLATVNAHWGIATDIPIVTRAVVLWRRGMRVLLRWYINPIVEQQNAYNLSVLNALRDLRSENDALHEEVARLRERLQPEESATA